MRTKNEDSTVFWLSNKDESVNSCDACIRQVTNGKPMIRRTLSCARNEISFCHPENHRCCSFSALNHPFFALTKFGPPGLIVLLVISEISCCYLLTRNLWKLEKWVASRCELLQPAAVGENMSLSIPSNLIPSNPIYSNPIPSQPIPWLSGPVPVRSLPHPGEAHRSGGWLRIHLGWTRGAWDRYFGHGIEWYRPPSNLSPVNFGQFW